MSMYLIFMTACRKSRQQKWKNSNLLDMTARYFCAGMKQARISQAPENFASVSKALSGPIACGCSLGPQYQRKLVAKISIYASGQGGEISHLRFVSTSQQPSWSQLRFPLIFLNGHFNAISLKMVEDMKNPRFFNALHSA